MDWYYVESDKQVGPLSEDQFGDLVRSGKIGSRTLVWREGLTDWQPYAEVGQGGVALGRPALAVSAPVATGGLVCAECGQSFGPDEVIRYGASWVCAACKPAFVQKLREGVARPATLAYAGFWIRFAAAFADGVILGVFNLIMTALIRLPLARGINPAEDMGKFLAVQGILSLIQLTIAISYETWFIGKFGATPGKMACKIKVVTPEGLPVGYGRAFGRYFAKLLSGLILCIGYLMAAFDAEKRALHDRICHTRVIKVG